MPSGGTICFTFVGGFMFSEEVKTYVIDNILSVDFFDVFFLDGLRKVLINSDPEYKKMYK